MAELSISSEEIRSALDSFVDSYKPTQAAVEEVGHVRRHCPRGTPARCNGKRASSL